MHGQNARNALSTKGSVTKEIKQDRQKAGRERKANNNDDLMQCEKKDTGFSQVYLIIFNLFFPATAPELFIGSGMTTIIILPPSMRVARNRDDQGLLKMKQYRLADFIRGNIEPTLQEWEDFARTIEPPA